MKGLAVSEGLPWPSTGSSWVGRLVGNLIFLLTKCVRSQTCVSGAVALRAVLPAGVGVRFAEHVLETKGKLMYLHCKMVYNKV